MYGFTKIVDMCFHKQVLRSSQFAVFRNFGIKPYKFVKNITNVTDSNGL